MKKVKRCPIFAAKSDDVGVCRMSRCAWYCEFAKECSIPLLAGMFADSEICRNVFNEPLKKDNPELIGGVGE